MANILEQHLKAITQNQAAAKVASVRVRSADHAHAGPGEIAWLYERAGLTDWINNPDLGDSPMNNYSFEGFGALPLPGITALRTTRAPAPTTPTTRTAAPIPVSVTPRTTTTAQRAVAMSKTAASAARVTQAASASAVQARARASAAAKAAPKRRGPPAWANAHAKHLRDADAKIARAMPPGVKRVIDKALISSTSKGKLKTSPITFLVTLAESDPKAVAAFIRDAKARGASVADVLPSDNPATVAAKLVQAAASKPSAAMQAATNKALSFSGFGGFGALPSLTSLSTMKTLSPTTSTSTTSSGDSITSGSLIGLTPILTALSPLTLDSLRTLSSGTTTIKPATTSTISPTTTVKPTITSPLAPVTTIPVSTPPPTKPPAPVQIAAAEDAAQVADAMIDATPPEVAAIAQAVAEEDDKIMGIPRGIVIAGGALGGLGLLALLLRKKKR